MAQALFPHPGTAAPALTLTAEAVRAGGKLSLRYALGGDLGGLVLPPPAARVHTDGLWKTSCFEAFLAGVGAGYLEINLAPSGAWAAYQFDGPRKGMRAAPLPPPAMSLRQSNGALALDAELDLSGIEFLAQAPRWRAGLTAVVEKAGGALSYWALAHPAPAPDFHDPRGFILQLGETL